MEDDNYGVYGFYFDLLRNLGTFPFSLENQSTRLTICTSGPFVWLYFVNFAAATFHLFFQGFQLFFIFLGDVDNKLLIAQLTWVLLAMLPLANMIKYMGDEKHFASVLNEWCLLERRIIGSAFRGLGISKSGPTPTLSTCHFRQRDRFTFMNRYYIVLGIIGAIALGSHVYIEPTFPAYISSLALPESIPDWLIYVAVVYQLYIYMIIWSNVYLIEVLATAISSSVGHILETLSYKGGVVMTRWTCDEVPILDLISTAKSIREGEDTTSIPGSALMKKSARKGSTLFQGNEDMQELFPKTEMSRVIQNLVDIEYGLEGYLRVESLIEAYNWSFGRIVPGHQFVYLLVLTMQGFNAIQYFSEMDPKGVALCTLLMALFVLRMIWVFPAMGNLDHRSDSFIDSWMEGLRYIPKGKQSYELYWYRIKSCRLLDFRCGRYFNMERQTCLEFLFRVSEFVIVLMQISYQ